VNLKLPDSGDYVELMLYTEPPPPDKRGTAHHMSLEVPDINLARHMVATRTNGYTRPLLIQTGVNRKRQMNLYDPDGTRVELMEPGPVDGIPAPPSKAPFPAITNISSRQ